jgi:hypothetical protein
MSDLNQPGDDDGIMGDEPPPTDPAVEKEPEPGPARTPLPPD